MILQIVITQYKDGEKCIKRLLDSINLQQDVDFNDFSVIIINDGQELLLNENLFKEYPFKIEYHIEEWSGLSGARQHGLEKVTADYVLFSDGDDLFYRNNALWDILTRLKKNKPDILTSQFTTDMCDRDTFKCSYFQTYNNDNVWIHGKVFRVGFLKEHDITWNVKLKIYEDSYFVRTCFAYNPKKENIDETIWFWKFRETSLTRTDADWTTKTYTDKMDSNAELVRSFLRRNMMDEASDYAFVQIMECYLTWFEDFWNESKNIQYKEKMEKHFVEYWDEFSYLLPIVKPANAVVMMDVLRRRFYKEKDRLSLEPITFEQWKNNMLEKYKKEF